MQIFNEFVFLSLLVVPAETFFCTESNKVTEVFCFVFIRDQPMWFIKPITSAGVREDKLLVPEVDFEAAQFG